jgi:hypothetical protein
VNDAVQRNLDSVGRLLAIGHQFDSRPVLVAVAVNVPDPGTYSVLSRTSKSLPVWQGKWLPRNLFSQYEIRCESHDWADQCEVYSLSVLVQFRMFCCSPPDLCGKPAWARLSAGVTLHPRVIIPLRLRPLIPESCRGRSLTTHRARCLLCRRSPATKLACQGS